MKIIFFRKNNSMSQFVNAAFGAVTRRRIVDVNAVNDRKKDFAFDPLSYGIVSVLLTQKMNGYSLLREVEEFLGRPVAIATLYRNIDRMSKSGLIEICDPPENLSDEERRGKFYTVTGFGTEVYDEYIVATMSVLRKGAKLRGISMLSTTE